MFIITPNAIIAKQIVYMPIRVLTHRASHGFNSSANVNDFGCCKCKTVVNIGLQSHFNTATKQT